MAWDMQWYDDDHSILLFTVKQGSTWNDFDGAMHKYGTELRQSGKTIHAIIYNEYGFPKANPIPHVKSQMHMLSEFNYRGLLITVSPKGSTSFVQSVAELVFRFMPKEMKQGVFVKTMDQALARIKLEQTETV